MMDDPGRIVGQRLKALRTERGLTVRELSHASDLAFNTISMIERGKMSPTIGTLHKLDSALGVALAHLVAEGPPKPIVYSRRGERKEAHSARVILENLGAGSPTQTLQALVLTLQPGADSGPDPIVHVGWELAFCLDGCVRYEVENQIYSLTPEDSLLFESHLPHRWRNGQDEPSRLILVLQASEGHEGALRRHLDSVEGTTRRARHDVDVGESSGPLTPEEARGASEPHA